MTPQPRDRGTIEGMSAEKMNDALFVSVRVRGGDVPANPHPEFQMQVGDKTISIDNENGSKTYSYDKVFGADSTQEEVYRTLGKRTLQSALGGYNTCLFAYGQTGSGKTHTMLGYKPEHGVIPRLCEELFEIMDERALKGNFTSKVEVEYLEIYGDKVRDLLDSGKGPGVHREVKIREHPKRGPYVEGLMRAVVTNVSEMNKLMDKGNQSRTVKQTDMNMTSSRSHAVFTITLSQSAFESVGDKKVVTSSTVSIINLVDLAGSERVKESNVQGVGLKEAGDINKSLMMLGRVIASLADKQQDANIPYRNTKLTFLLKESLGGNSRTSMIATINPDLTFVEETMSTLRYAAQATKIINAAVVNEDPNARKIKDLQDIVRQLREQLTLAQLAVGETDDPEQRELLQKKLNVNTDLMRKLHMVWEGAAGVETGKSRIEYLECTLADLRKDSKMGSKKYKQLSQELAGLKRQASAEEQNLRTQETGAAALVAEREKLALKERELANLREALSEQIRETEYQVTNAENELEYAKLEEQGLRQVSGQSCEELSVIIEGYDRDLAILRRKIQEAKTLKKQLDTEANELEKELESVDSDFQTFHHSSVNSAGFFMTPPVSAHSVNTGRSGSSSGSGESPERKAQLWAAHQAGGPTANVHSINTTGSIDKRREMWETVLRTQMTHLANAQRQLTVKDRESKHLQAYLQKQRQMTREEAALIGPSFIPGGESSEPGPSEPQASGPVPKLRLDRIVNDAPNQLGSPNTGSSFDTSERGRTTARTAATSRSQSAPPGKSSWFTRVFSRRARREKKEARAADRLQKLEEKRTQLQERRERLEATRARLAAQNSPTAATTLPERTAAQFP